MKVVFIEPLAKFANWTFGWGGKIPFLGPVYLSTILKNRGHDVQIYKESIELFDPKKIKADVLCLHTLTSSANRAYEIAKEFKRSNPQAKTIIGGIHVSLIPNDVPDYIDHIVIGEAESVIIDVVEGKIKSRFVNGEPCMNLDSLPYPNFSLIKKVSKMRYLPISTSRGCPFDCNFCTVTKMFGRKYRFRSVESVIDELQHQKYRGILFYDDHFAANKERTKQILRRIHSLGLAKSWIGQLRVDVANDDELLRLMAKTHCDYVILGLESFNDQSLKFYNKNQSLINNKEAIRKLQDNGIKIFGHFMFGDDFDTLKSIRKTVDFCNKLDISLLNFSALTPLPGTQIYDLFEKEKRIFTKDWGAYDFRHVTFKPKLISAYDLQKEINDAYYKSYFLTKRGFRVLFQEIGVIPKALRTMWTYHKENENYLEFLKKMDV